MENSQDNQILNSNNTVNTNNNFDQSSINNLNNSNSSQNLSNSQNINNTNLQKMKVSNILLEFLSSLIFTKNCHIVSFILIVFLMVWIFYLFSFMNFHNCSIMKLESEESYFWLIIWVINIIIFLITWNFYVFLFTSIFNYEYSKGNGNVRSSFAEEFYKSPFGFILLFYYFDNKSLNNSIDNSLWILLGFEYGFIHYNLVQFYKQFNKEIFTKIDNPHFILYKMKVVSIIFILISCLVTFINYVIVRFMKNIYIFFFMSRGIFAILKVVELWKTRYDEYKFLISGMEEKEKYYLSNIKTKSYLELITMAYVYYQIAASLIMGEGKPFYLTALIIYFIINLGYQCIKHFKKFDSIKEYYNTLDNSLKKINLKEYDECIICAEKIVIARQLPCNHYFHLICLSKWLEKGNNNCPLCRAVISPIDINNRNANNENSNINEIINQNINHNINFRHVFLIIKKFFNRILNMLRNINYMIYNNNMNNNIGVNNQNNVNNQNILNRLNNVSNINFSIEREVRNVSNNINTNNNANVSNTSNNDQNNNQNNIQTNIQNNNQNNIQTNNQNNNQNNINQNNNI